MALHKLNKGDFLLFLDVSKSQGAAPKWVRIGLSRAFRIDFGTVAVTRDYIRRDAPVTLAAGCQPRLDGELSLYQGDPAYDFVSELLYALPVGREAAVPVLVLFGGEEKRAWRCDGCTLLPRAIDVVGGRMTFALMLSGGIERGRYRMEGDAPAFVEA